MKSAIECGCVLLSYRSNFIINTVIDHHRSLFGILDVGRTLYRQFYRLQTSEFDRHEDGDEIVYTTCL